MTPFELRMFGPRLQADAVAEHVGQGDVRIAAGEAGISGERGLAERGVCVRTSCAKFHELN